MPDDRAKPDGLELLYVDYFDILYKLACRQLYRRMGYTVDAADAVQYVFLITA